MTRNDIHVYYAYLRDGLRSDGESGDDFLSLSDRQRIGRMQKEIDRARSRIGRSLLRHALSELNIREEAVSEIEWDEYQKPFIKSIYPLQFSISHAGQLVVCVTSFCKVGVDVEKIDDSFDFELCGTAGVFSPSEMKFMEQSANPRLDFFRLWTLKESVLKANGTGFSFPADHVETLTNPVMVQNERYYTFHEFMNGYSFSLAVSSVYGRIQFEKVCLL